MIIPIRILIPAADGHPLAWETLRGISMQSVPCEVVVISRAKTHKTDMYLIRACEARVRTELIKYASSPYVMMCDTDVAFTDSNDVKDAIAHLESHTELDAVTLNAKAAQNLESREQVEHVDLGVVCIRTSSLKDFVFSGFDGNCCCIDFNQKMNIKYLDNRQLITIERRGA
jgi:hypothetical protein